MNQKKIGGKKFERKKVWLFRRFELISAQTFFLLPFEFARYFVVNPWLYSNLMIWYIVKNLSFELLWRKWASSNTLPWTSLYAKYGSRKHMPFIKQLLETISHQQRNFSSLAGKHFPISRIKRKGKDILVGQVALPNSVIDI